MIQSSTESVTPAIFSSPTCSSKQGMLIVYSLSNLALVLANSQPILPQPPKLNQLELCGPTNTTQLLAGQRISITSPNYPRKYPNNITCRWIIFDPHCHTIMFKRITWINSSQCFLRWKVKGVDCRLHLICSDLHVRNNDLLHIINKRRRWV